MKNKLKILKYWKKQLRMSDYNIKLKYPDESIESQGSIEYSNTHKCAVISIMSENNYGNRMLKYDFEVILVHELLHLKYGIIESSLSDEMYNIHHQTLDDLARALVFSKRSKSVKSYENF